MLQLAKTVIEHRGTVAGGVFLLLLGSVHVAAAAEQSGGAARATRASAAHPFSDPVYLPMRKPARAGCMNGNPGIKSNRDDACIDPPKHGYAAMDMYGQLDDPIHPAGAGIFHPKPASPDCVPKRDGELNGQAVYIDHGGGVESRYQHLNTINKNLKDGDLVTPDMVIGTMGHSGGVCPVMHEHLHFEIRKHGERADLGFGQKDGGLGSLYACVRGTRQVWPRAIYNADNWNEVVWHDLITPESDTCDVDVQATPDPPRGFDAKAGDKSATIIWSAPPAAAGVDHVTLETQILRPSAGTQERWKEYPGDTTRIELTGLTNGWTYKFRIYLHNEVGYSAATEWQSVEPLGVPTTPTGPQAVNGISNTVRYSWGKSYDNGSPVTGYEVGIRKRLKDGWSEWDDTKTRNTDTRYRWDGLDHAATYQVRVRATSSAGPSDWLGPNQVKTERRK